MSKNPWLFSLPMELCEIPAKQPILLNNTTCPYCGCELTAENANKEHVIGRKFVPKGTLDGNWNLIVTACKACNAKKGDLEDEISAVTMQPNAAGQYASNHNGLIADSKRKAKGARSRRNGKFIGESTEVLVAKMLFLGGQLTANFTAPPQVTPERVLQLAMMHVMAFFYLVTYNGDKRAGGFWRGNFMMFPEACKEDWGNRTHTSFMKAVVCWEPRFMASGPDEFFKVVLRKHPDADCWSWALEWNQNFRMIVFCGDPVAAENVYFKFKELPSVDLPDDQSNKITIRSNQHLDMEADILFDWDDPEGTKPDHVATIPPP